MYSLSLSLWCGTAHPWQAVKIAEAVSGMVRVLLLMSNNENIGTSWHHSKVDMAQDNMFNQGGLLNKHMLVPQSIYKLTHGP